LVARPLGTGDGCTAAGSEWMRNGPDGGPILGCPPPDRTTTGDVRRMRIEFVTDLIRRKSIQGVKIPESRSARDRT
jgi:hypothetical protein